MIRGAAHLGGPTLVVENGDLNDHPEEQDRLKYQYQIQALNKIECAAFNLGEQDLSLGLPFLLQRADEADFPFLSANLADPEGAAPFASSVTVTREVEGVPRTVQIVGVIAESMDLFIQETGLVIGSAREAIQTTLSESADARIVLFHGDRQEARKAVRGLIGIDLVIATSHERDEPFESIEEGFPPIVGNGLKGKLLGRISIRFGADGPEVGAAAPETLTHLVPDSPDVVPILKEYYQEVKTRNLIDDVAIVNPAGGGSTSVARRAASATSGSTISGRRPSTPSVSRPSSRRAGRPIPSVSYAT
ncbi:MAG: hypothetical protein O7H41_16590 [Planctomycetota bacterium]|nr:hypothetical protein [Planctomycetota bacterium]